MNNRVLTLIKVGGLPAVSFAHHVARHADGWYRAYGPEEAAPPEALNATCYPVILYLFEDAPDRFVVFGEKGDLDKLGAGPQLVDHTGDWSHYQIDGDMPDTNPEVEPGARAMVSNVVVLAQKPPSDVSESKPLMVGAVRVTTIKRSISSTTGSMDLKLTAEGLQ